LDINVQHTDPPFFANLIDSFVTGSIEIGMDLSILNELMVRYGTLHLIDGGEIIMNSMLFTRTRSSSSVTHRESKERRIFRDEEIDESSFPNTRWATDDQWRRALGLSCWFLISDEERRAEERKRR
jgi:hypothetical protein